MAKTILLHGPSLSATGGVPTHVRQLLAAPMGGEFKLVHFQAGSEGLEESWLDKLIRFTGSPLGLGCALIRYRVSAVHLNSTIDAKALIRDAVYCFVSKVFRRKVIYQLHGGLLPDDVLTRRNILTGIFKWLVRRADAVVVLTSEELEAYRLWAAKGNIRLIANGIDLAPYAMATPKSFPKEDLNLVYIGRLIPSKGVEITVRAIHYLRQQGDFPSVRFIIAGCDSVVVDLKKRIEELNLGSLVRILGPVFGWEKVKFWKEAHIFVFPTASERLPYSMLESLASGTPLITTRVGAIPDFIQDGVQGIFVQPFDVIGLAERIKALCGNTRELERMSAECVKTARERCGIDRLARDFAELYREVLSG